jgi:hypothetical protein
MSVYPSTISHWETSDNYHHAGLLDELIAQDILSFFFFFPFPFQVLPVPLPTPLDEAVIDILILDSPEHQAYILYIDSRHKQLCIAYRGNLYQTPLFPIAISLIKRQVYTRIHG